MASKFLFIFFMAYFLDVSELGLYGLVTVTIGYSMYFLGLDFYIYTTREVVKSEGNDWGGMIRDQAVLSLALYIVFLPILSLIFFRDYLPWNLIVWFYILLVLEHLNQEAGRLLVAISEPLTASVVLFLRSGIWALVITGFMFANPWFRSLEAALSAWIIGSFLALVVAIYRLGKLKISGWKENVNWAWILRGVKISVPFLVATLAIRGVFTVDRYWFQSLVGVEMLGVYVLFVGVCNALISFLDAGVFVFIYPSLIDSFHKKNSDEFRLNLNKLLLQTLVISVAFSAVAILMITPLLLWIDKPFYLSQISLFYWLILAFFLFALGMVPHYALYAQNLDKSIITGHIYCLIIFILATWLYSFYWPLFAVPFGLCSALLFLLLWKLWSFYKFTPPQYQFSITIK